MEGEGGERRRGEEGGRKEGKGEGGGREEMRACVPVERGGGGRRASAVKTGQCKREVGRVRDEGRDF